MSRNRTTAPKGLKKPLRVGFLPENDSAPIVLAHEMGFFQQHGLAVELQSLASWKHVHDRILTGELDAAHSPATLPFLINLGLTSLPGKCVAGMVLSLQGNAITVSRQLWNQGVRDAETLREQLWSDRNKRRYTFGVTSPLSPQYVLLCDWLRSAKGAPCTNIHIETIAPEQLFPLLKLGYLDGYCAGEPWNSVAVQAGVGACIATSATLAPLHPEKVLLVREDFAQERAAEHERLIAAILEACRFCEQRENRLLVADILGQPKYVNAPVECLQPGLVGPFGQTDSRLGSLYGLNIFHRNGANEPSAAKAAWVRGRLFEFLRWSARPAGLKHVFRSDIFERAKQLVRKPSKENIASNVLPMLACPAT